MASPSCTGPLFEPYLSYTHVIFEWVLSSELEIEIPRLLRSGLRLGRQTTIIEPQYSAAAQISSQLCQYLKRGRGGLRVKPAAGRIHIGVFKGEMLTDIHLATTIEIVITPKRNIPYTVYF